MSTPSKPQNKLAVATVSLGRHPSHTLERKIAAAASHGFHGIELVYADLANHASANNNGDTSQSAILTSARQIHTLCTSSNITILSLNPFKNFEGTLSIPLEDRLATARQWLEVASACGARFFQVPSNFLPPASSPTSGSTGDFSVTIPELQALADLASSPDYGGIAVAYEAVAFGAHVRTWQDALRVVQAVDRPASFGLCLDSFHEHSLLWADPYSGSGVAVDGAQRMADSMTEFLARSDELRDRVFYVQLSDASRFDPPLTDDSALFDGLEVHDARLAWSRNARPFPLEKPGYFPVVEMARHWIREFGWNGWVSLEGFLRETAEEGNGPEVMAGRAEWSIGDVWRRLDE